MKADGAPQYDHDRPPFIAAPPMVEPEPADAAVDAPEDAPLTREKVDFPCGNCGAKMTWDPATDALSCEYCGQQVAVPRAEGTILERPLSEAGAAARGLGLEVRVASCQNCGARVSFEQQATAELCVYCGSASVLAQSANRNALRPESLLPLDVSRDEVQEHFRKWIRGLWFRPSALKRTARFEAVGIYVPFWTFDCRVHSDWSADAGYYYYETRIVWVKGRPQTQQVRKVRWVPAWGSRDDAFDDLLVNASKGVPEKLLTKLGGFDTKGLVPYRPDYLAGWRAEEYALDLEQSWQIGLVRVEEAQRAACAGDVPGDTQRNLRVQNHVSDVTWKHVLLPIWSLQYRFGAKSYTVLVNGQSGRINGQAPISWAKILLLVLVLALVAAIVVLAAQLA